MLLRLWAKYVLFLGISLRETPASQHVFACGRNTCCFSVFRFAKHLPANMFSPMAKYMLLVYSAHEIHFLQVIIGRGDLGDAFIHVVIFQA